MKKSLLSLAALVAAVTTQAATINWGNSGTTSALVGLDGTTKLTQASATAAAFAIQLLYWNGGYATAIAAVDTTPGVPSLSKTAGQLQTTSNSYTYPTTYATGAQFFIRATAKFGATSYYMDIFRNNAFGTTWSTATVSDGGTDTFAWATANYGGVGAAGSSGKWVAVPEPASGLLALAGAALLIRRRRRG